MCGLVRIGSQFRELSQIIVSRGGLMNRRHKKAFILNLVLTCCLVFKADFWIDFSACVQGVEVSNSVCTGCKFFYNAVILVLHNATTSHAYLLQTMKIAPAASAKPAKPISNMQVD